tara:strand:+ start:3444 stop:3617 length:174 start_codon:yes stop_codon:yes gene_type:complete
MKHRHPLSFALFGAAMVVTGVAFELNHLMGAVMLSNVGFVSFVTGLIWLIISILRAR